MHIDAYWQGYNERVMEDLTSCAYFMRSFGGDPKGTCSFGCREEPSCHTDMPIDGWPEARRLERAMEFAKERVLSLLNELAEPED